MDARHLSKRLATVAKYVQEGARLADIGSDHAYLPASLILNGQISFAVAGEVVKGPFENELHEVEKLRLQDQLIPRLANGLAAIHPKDRIDTISIAGMGGSLITNILDEGQAQMKGVKRLILQPNVGELRVRTWLMNHQWQIQDEQILAEDGHTYEIIVAEPTICPVRYGKRELLFGPFLLEHPSKIFQEKWLAELGRNQQAVVQMRKATHVPQERLAHMESKIKLIQEVLEDDNRN